MDDINHSSETLAGDSWKEDTLSYIDELEARLRADTEELKPYAIEILSVDNLLITEPEEPDQIIKNIFDKGDKLAVIGPSKTRKSFFLMQLGFSLATGTNFFDFEVPKPRKVLLVQYEIQPKHFHRRIKSMALAMGVEASYVAERFHAINARGKGIELIEIQKIVEDGKYDVVILDPLYKLFEGNENDSEVVKGILKIFDNIVTKSGAALIFSHHDRKGSAGKQELTDRGSGAGVIGRDYDAAMFLSEHLNGKDILNFEFVLRNYSAPEPKVLEWFEYNFILSELEPADKKAGARAPKAVHDLVTKSLELLGERTIALSIFRDEIQTNLGISQTAQRALIDTLTTSRHIKILPHYPKMGLPKRVQRVVSPHLDDDKLF